MFATGCLHELRGQDDYDDIYVMAFCKEIYTVAHESSFHR